jgi:hypothetical protein
MKTVIEQNFSHVFCNEIIVEISKVGVYKRVLAGAINV